MQKEDLQTIGLVFTICIVLCFNIIILNLIIAILANTYNIFDNKSNGLYLSKILMSRDEMIYDENYGSFLSAMPPLNFVQIPALPIAMFLRQKHPLVLSANKLVMQIQYVMFMMIFFLLFIIGSWVLNPIAYIVGILDKIKTMDLQPSSNEKIKNNIMFIIFGEPILFFDFLADTYWFWVNSFRSFEQLRQIIIIKEKSTITHMSIREIQNNCIKYNNHKIKTVNTATIVKNFSRHLEVTQNLQFLIFAQFIPRGGWGSEENTANRGYTLKTMKTQELEEQRKEELRLLDDTEQRLCS